MRGGTVPAGQSAQKFWSWAGRPGPRELRQLHVASGAIVVDQLEVSLVRNDDGAGLRRVSRGVGRIGVAVATLFLVFLLAVTLQALGLGRPQVVRDGLGLGH